MVILLILSFTAAEKLTGFCFPVKHLSNSWMYGTAHDTFVNMSMGPGGSMQLAALPSLHLATQSRSDFSHNI